MSLAQSNQQLQQRWSRLPGREKSGIWLAALAVLALLLWQFSMAPSLATLRTSGAQARVQSAQLQHMLALQQQVEVLQKQPPLGVDDAYRALGLAARQTLGSAAQLALAGDRVSVTLKNVPADALADWLTQSRLTARSVPLEARLTRSTIPGTGPVAWSGVLVMGLPAR